MTTISEILLHSKQKFFNNVIAVNEVMIRPEKSVHVNIMDEPEARHRFPEFSALLDKHQVSYTINKIRYDQTQQL